MYGNTIQDFFSQEALRPQAAAQSMVMLVVTFLLVALAAHLVNLKGVRMTGRQPAINARRRSPLLTSYFAGLISLLYLPLAVLLLFSFHAGEGLSPFHSRA
jgi:ABC-type spermidine/putrescine transport system permease subunit II